MKYLSIILIFSGYVLIYSAVAKQGHFATEPWASLFSDAYIEPIFGQPGQTPQQNAAAIQQAVNQTPGAVPVGGPVSAITPGPPPGVTLQGGGGGGGNIFRNILGAIPIPQNPFTGQVDQVQF